MICIIALVVFGILGIFSASHRKIAFEAFDCVFRKITLRPCQSGLDTRLKTDIVSRFLRISPQVGKHVYKRFEWYSWAFTLAMIISTLFVGIGAYNYIMYGNCNGPSNSFCVFNAAKEEGTSALANPLQACGDAEALKSMLIPPQYQELNASWFGSGTVRVIEFGCYTCEYTLKAEENAAKLREQYANRINYTFIPFPIPSHPLSNETARAAACAQLQGKFWEYHQLLVTMKSESENEKTDAITTSKVGFTQIAAMVGLNEEEFSTCLESEESARLVQSWIRAGHAAGIYGTPTFFIENDSLVGPQTTFLLKNYVRKND